MVARGRSRGTVRSENRGTVGMAAFAAAVLSLAGLPIVSGETPPQAPPADQGISVAVATMAAPLTEGPKPDLELLFTAQVAGWIEPCG
jgi:hypothetical protein